MGIRNIECSLALCLYNENEKCTLSTIQINEYGMCDDCQFITLTESDLKTLKKIEKAILEKRLS